MTRTEWNHELNARSDASLIEVETACGDTYLARVGDIRVALDGGDPAPASPEAVISELTLSELAKEDLLSGENNATCDIFW